MLQRGAGMPPAALLLSYHNMSSRITAILIGIASFASADPGMDFPPTSYTQEIKLTFRDAAAAAKAQIAIEPLFNGHHRAVSCRWDDNAPSNVETRQRMENSGVRGTWYLNNRNHGSGYAKSGEGYDYLETARGLLQGGNSIGAHSLTHPFITYYHRNRMFEETAGCRIEWEANLDTPVLSYAYSFIDLRAEPEMKEIQLETLRTLERAGLYHVSEYLEFFTDIPHAMELSPIMPTENNPIDVFAKAVKWAYDDAQFAKYGPMISNSMHAWYGTKYLDFGFDEFERRLKVMSSLEDVWHCNQNQYGSYRRQFRATAIDTEIDGSTVTVRLERPRLTDLNDAAPLTLAVRNAAADDLLKIDCATADVAPSTKPREGKLLFHLAHDRDQRMPEKIGHVANPENQDDFIAADADFPQINGGLRAVDGGLSLALQNHSESPLENLRVTWRTPLAYEEGVRVEDIGTVDAAAKRDFKLKLTPSDSDKARIGSAYFVAQADFTHAGKPGRIHFTCNRAAVEPDSSWPREGFALLGPIPKEHFDAGTLAGRIVQDGCPENLTLNGTEPLVWRSQARDGFIRQDWLDPEYIRTMGTWDAASPGYLLRSKVHSPEAREVEFICSRPFIGPIILNGQRVSDFKAELKAGENELVIVYPPDVLRVGGVRLAACFLRLADPATGERCKDITYQPW